MDRPEVQEAIVKIAWKQCVGQRIREISNPSSFRKGILTIEVSHSQWKGILASMKVDIIARMNHFIRKPLLKDLHIRIV